MINFFFFLKNSFCFICNWCQNLPKRIPSWIFVSIGNLFFKQGRTSLTYFMYGVSFSNWNSNDDDDDDDDCTPGKIVTKESWDRFLFLSLLKWFVLLWFVLCIVVFMFTLLVYPGLLSTGLISSACNSIEIPVQMKKVYFIIV